MIGIKTSKLETTSFSLHIMAMIFMLADHSCILLFPHMTFFRSFGRLAFPIFAFMAVEGYFHTRSLKKYILRLFVCAILSEIPYNILIAGTFFEFSRRNVLWTLLCGILLIHSTEYIRKRFNSVLINLLAIMSVCGACLVFGKIVRPDYGYAGILTIILFYLFREKNVPNLICQLLFLFGINAFLLGSSKVFIGNFGFPRQLLAVLALIPIWLYNGKQGYKSKWLSFIYYAFYPLHIIILVIIRIAIQ